MKRFLVLFLVFVPVLFLGRFSLYSQTVREFTTINQTENDTIPMLSEKELQKIPSIRSVFDKQQQLYMRPIRPSTSLSQIIGVKEDRPLTISPEAKYWFEKSFDTSSYFYPWVNFSDTVVVNPLFMPLIVKGDLVNFEYIRPDKDKVTLSSFKKEPLYTRDTLFADYERRKDIQQIAYNYVRTNHPESFQYSIQTMPGKSDMIRAEVIKKTLPEEAVIPVKIDVTPTDYDAPVKFIPERRYWTSGFDATLQFAQNYISENWHKGGTSNMNIFGRAYFLYNYDKDKVKVTNELELKAQVFTAPNDEYHDYRIGDDLFRVHSNFGYRAFKGWYYTFDVDFKTQMFTNFKENSEIKQAALLSPFSVDLGLGMKYDLNKSFESNKHKKLTLAVNIAPVSVSYKYSVSKNIDLGRHGFQKKKDSEDVFNQSLTNIGSSLKLNMVFTFNRDISWQSRLDYFTSYDRVLMEFENTLNFAISRFFSTRLYAHLRFDDGVSRPEDKPNQSFFQLNELLSIGFNYKW